MSRRKSCAVYVNPRLREQLREIAVERETTIVRAIEYLVTREAEEKRA